MAHLLRPGELLGGQPPAADGREFIHIDIGPMGIEHGYTRALIAPGTTVRADDAHKITLLEGQARSHSFAAIQPLIYVDEVARTNSEVKKSGLNQVAIRADVDNHRFQKCGHVLLFRPTAPEGPNIILGALIGGSAQSKKLSWEAIESELPRQVLITDEGIESDSGYPKTLAERISLHSEETFDISLVLVAPSEDDDDQGRLNPILWNPDEIHETGITVGTIKIDPLRLTAQGLTDWTAIGITIVGPNRSSTMTAGLILTTSGLAQQEIMSDTVQPNELGSHEAEVRQITDAHRAG